MRLVWTTDPHLNHVPVGAWERWLEILSSLGPDAVVVTGDISEGEDVAFQLQRLAGSVDVPIHFVLGNHDFYQSSIARTRQRIVELCREHPLLNYLTDSAALDCGADTFLIGEDGWGDAVEGDYDGSIVHLNDFRLIDDFRLVDPSRWKTLLREQGEASAERLAEKLSRLPDSARHVLVATHVPPFREACWYEGRTTDDHWAPFFVCGSVGRTLRRASESRPACQFTVLCGHTHHGGVAELTANLKVHTGSAEYGHPAAQGWIEAGDELRVIVP